MSLSLADLQTKRDALVSAMARGVYSVESGGDRVVYQTLEQMERALAMLDAEIATASGATTSRVTLVGFSRG